MSNKKERPVIENPLAHMGLDDIVRDITNSDDITTTGKERIIRVRRSKAGASKILEKHLLKYTGISEQGTAVWLPKEVKKKLELICANSNRNIPIRSLAGAIIMSYIEENSEVLDDL